MKRFLALALLLSAVSCGVAQAGGIGVEVFGGRSFPLLQSDAGNGTLYGVRAPVSVVPFIALEPYYASTSLADKVTTIGTVNVTQPGFDEKIYGVNARFAMGGPLSFYPVVGYGHATIERAGTTDRSFNSYSGGFGMNVSPVPKLGLDLRGEMQAIVDGHTTRKFLNATAGLSYSLFSVP